MLKMPITLNTDTVNPSKIVFASMFTCKKFQVMKMGENEEKNLENLQMYPLAHLDPDSLDVSVAC